MKKNIVTAILVLACVTSFSQAKTPPLTDGAALLFKNTKSKLTNDEKNWIFKQINFV